MTKRGRWAALAVVAVALIPVLAEARVGGGQSFGRGGGGGGGGGSGGGGGELVLLLLELLIRYPAVGCPVLVVAVVLFVGYTLANANTAPRQVVRTHAQRGRYGVPGLERLRDADPGYSRVVLLDYLVLLHARAHEALGNGQWDALKPFVTDEARDQLRGAHDRVSEVSEVVVGGVELARVDTRGGYDLLTVLFEVTQLERGRDGTDRRVDVKERWVLRRAIGATSLPPDRIERLGCPNCGASIEVTPMGTCRNCDTPIVDGQLQWQAVLAKVESRRPATAPEVGWAQGGDESSVFVPTLADPALPARLRELRARHPEFDQPAFLARVDLVYRRLQESWSAGRWEQARPYCTDRMFQTLRFWVERYTRNHLRNRLEDVELERVGVVRVDVDAWYESITVRLWGSMKDAIVDERGKVVGGNPTVARRFSEYWTFVRASGSGGATKGGEDRCPSCGAPLDRVDQAGICGYCGSKITSGRFDWVLARIDQPEAYSG